jgi:hypothetical protein
MSDQCSPSIVFERLCQHHKHDARQMYQFYRQLICYVDPLQDLGEVFTTLGCPHQLEAVLWLRKKLLKSRTRSPSDEAAEAAQWQHGGGATAGAGAPRPGCTGGFESPTVGSDDEVGFFHNCR